MLYLFPNLLADLESHAAYLPSSVDAAVSRISGLIAENEKEGRRFLRRFSFEGKTFRDIPIRLLNEHTTPAQKKELLNEVFQSRSPWGLISDCGMPCLADPGADFVLMAREKGMSIETFAGPSSILFALVLSGLGGQHFTFHGYLPKEDPQLTQEIKRLEKTPSTHLFIETPYRNQKLLEKLLNTLDGETWLCVACDLSLPTQMVETKRIKEWKKKALPDINKRPAVFAIKKLIA